MLLAAFLMAQAPLQPESIDALDERYSAETKTTMVHWITCTGTGVYERRDQATFTVKDAEEVKAECRNEYDTFVENVVTDLKPSTDAATATQIARSFLDRVDLRAIFTPKAPLQLVELPVSKLVGNWRLGNGPLASNMIVKFTADGTLLGTISSKSESLQDGLVSWRIVSDGTKEAIFHASFADGTVVKYARIPSFPGEMTFVNASSPNIQRYDLKVEDSFLFLSYVKPDVGAKLRFSRRLESAERSKSD